MKIQTLLYRGVLVVALACQLIPGLAFGGENNTKVSKTINEGYRMPKNGHLEVTNKYGQVVINNTDSDSVTFSIEIIAYGKDRETANKILDRVDFDFEQTNEYLGLETVLDRKSGAFKELWNNIGDYSKTLLSKNKLVVNYQINVPKSLTIEINNKFGDVFMPDRSKKVTIEMSHGNLRANEFGARSNISVSYGSVEIKRIHSGHLTFKAADVTIKNVGNVEIESSSSEIRIDTADDMEIISRSDKSVKLGSVNRLSGKMNFSNLEIELLNKNIDFDLSYSDIQIDHVPFSFAFMRINGKSSDISLTFDEKIYMEVDIKADEEKFNFPYVKLDKERLDDKKGLTRYRGIVGVKNNYKGDLNIDSQKGAVDIRLKTLQQSVKNK